MPASDTHLSGLVVREIANREDVDPTDLPPLYEAIDPDALDALFGEAPGRSPSTRGSVRFVYCGREVTVSSDGEVDVSSAPDESGLHDRTHPETDT